MTREKVKKHQTSGNIHLAEAVEAEAPVVKLEEVKKEAPRFVWSPALVCLIAAMKPRIGLKL